MPRPKMTDAQRRARLASRHRLLPEARAGTVEEVAESLVALHSTDPVSVFLSVAARVTTPSVELVEEALYVRRSLIRHHAMRRTLWVMQPETTVEAHAACTTPIARREWQRFLDWLGDTDGIDEPEAWAENARRDILEHLRIEGPATTRAVGVAIPELRAPISVAAGTRQETTIPAHSRMLLILGFLGEIIRTRPTGTWIASHFAWDLASRWGVPDLEDLSEAEGARRLAQKVLDRFGPCTTKDLRWWMGLKASTVSTAIASLGVDEVEFESGETGWVLPGDHSADPDPGPWVALLPALDPTAMGWKDRDWYVEPSVAERVFDRNGNAGPSVWADGRLIGGWAQRPDGSLAIELVAEIGASHQELLEIEVERMIEFIGDARFRVRFPSPNQKDLLT